MLGGALALGASERGRLQRAREGNPWSTTVAATGLVVAVVLAGGASQTPSKRSPAAQ